MGGVLQVAVSAKHVWQPHSAQLQLFVLQYSVQHGGPAGAGGGLGGPGGAGGGAGPGGGGGPHSHVALTVAHAAAVFCALQAGPYAGGSPGCT
jgi:hypothetical protein